MLEDCASYLDGTIYNLEAKVTNFDDNQSVIQQMLQLQNAGTTNQSSSLSQEQYNESGEYEQQPKRQ